MTAPTLDREQLVAASRAYGKGSMRSDLAEFGIACLDRIERLEAALRRIEKSAPGRAAAIARAALAPPEPKP